MTLLQHHSCQMPFSYLFWSFPPIMERRPYILDHQYKHTPIEFFSWPSLFTYRVCVHLHFSEILAFRGMNQVYLTKPLETVLIHTVPSANLYTKFSFPWTSKPLGCSTYTSSLISPFKTADLTSNWKTIQFYELPRITKF